MKLRPNTFFFFYCYLDCFCLSLSETVCVSAAASLRCSNLLQMQLLTWFSFSNHRDLPVFEELFSFACPKFLSPVVPNYDNVHPDYHKEPFRQQLKVFAEEVQQQAQLSTIRR